MATSTVSLCATSRNGQAPSSSVCGTQGYFSVGKTASYLGVSPSQVRILCEQGHLTGYTLASGHRRLSVASVKAYSLGTSEDDIQGLSDGKAIIGYCRTSNISQKESLVRQEGRLRETIATRESIVPSEVEIRKECCSSFGERKVFNQLVLDIISGKVKKVYCEHWNRISRTMALNKLLDHLCDTFGVEIVALDKEENQDELGNNLQELLDFVQVLSCRQAAQKSRLVTVVHLEVKTIERITELSNLGHTQRFIVQTIQKENHRDTKGEVIGKHVIRKCILLNGQVKTALGQPKDEQSNLNKILTKWVSEHIQPCEGGYVTSKDIIQAYNQFAKLNGVAKVPPTFMGKWLKKNGFTDSFSIRIDSNTLRTAIRNICLV